MSDREPTYEGLGYDVEPDEETGGFDRPYDDVYDAEGNLIEGDEIRDLS